jgi:hypothetical protein
LTLIIANATFSYAGKVYTHGVTYDTADAAVSAANTAVSHLFAASGGTKTAQTTFFMRDSRGGGLDRVVWKGEVLSSSDAAVTQAPGLFT